MISATVEVYIDNINLRSKKKKVYLMYPQQVFVRLNQFNTKLNIIKYIFGITFVNILSYVITNKGTEVESSKIMAVTNMAPPKSKIQIQKLRG